MTDPGKPTDEPTTREWLKAVVVVSLGAVLTTAFLIWFALNVLFGTCCTSPTPAP